MRFAFAFALLLAACGGSSQSNADADMGVFLDASSSQACFSIAECAFQCAATSTSCVQGCIAQGTSDAQATYNTLLMCGYTQCMLSVDSTDGGDDTDGGSTSNTTCMSATDDSPACEQCVQTKIESTACATAYTACSNS